MGIPLAIIHFHGMFPNKNHPFLGYPAYHDSQCFAMGLAKGKSAGVSCMWTAYTRKDSLDSVHVFTALVIVGGSSHFVALRTT